MNSRLSAIQQLSAQILTRRVIFLLGILVLGGFGLLLVGDLTASRHREYAAAQRDSENLSRVLERQIGAAVSKIDVVLAETAYDFTHAPSLQDGNQDLLRRMAFIPEVPKESLRIISDQGRIVYSATAASALPDVMVADRAYFQQQKNNPQAGLVLSEPLLSRVSGQWQIILSRRISRVDGSFEGLVQTALRTDYFQSLFDGLDIGPHGNVSLFDTDMRLLARLPATPERLGQHLDHPEVSAGLAANLPTGRYETRSMIDGVHRLFVYRKLEGLPYVVVIGRAPQDFLFSWKRKALLYGLAFVGLAMTLLYCLRLFHQHHEKTRQLVSQVFETTREGIVVTDASGVIVTANQAFSRITGYPLAEAIGQTNAILKSDRHDDAFYTEMWRALVGRGDWRGEIWNRRKNGETYPVLMSINALRDGQDRTSNYIGIFSDITELYEARHQAEAANQAKGEFLATMSHEIRTPMNGIIGMTGLLLDTKLAPDQRHFAETIRISSESLLSIINDILDFSRIEAGRLELEDYPFDISSMVEGVADLLAPRVVGKQLEMSVYVDPDLQGEFLGDAGRIRQVMMNLVGNAVKFTEKGSISITATRSLSMTDGEQLRVTVTDSGIGIPDEAKPRLFGEFTQADASTARRFGGSGLGLAICRGIVTMMGGQIGFDSALGQGSRFWFTIPLRRLSGQQAPHDTPMTGLMVLVVDDTAANVEVFTRQIEGWGAKVMSATSALDGLARLRAANVANHGFDLAILDHHMPGMTGLDLASVIKADPALRGVRMVLASSAPTLEIRQNPDKFGFEAILTKPVRPSALLDCLMSALGQGRACPPQQILEQNQPPTTPLRLLVVEDNAINQQVAAGLLARLGHRADVANDGGEAVVLVERGDYDLVLMDVQMPGMDGIAATKAIRAFATAKANVPIIAMTANAMTGDREAFLAAGMNDYISKPISRRSLQHLLERWSNRLHSGGDEPPPLSEISTTPPAQGLLNHNVQDELRHELGEKRFLQLSHRLFSHLADQLADCEAAAQTGELAEVGRIIHSLKGAAGNLGFSGMLHETLAIEQSIRDQDGQVMARLSRLRTCAEASQAAFDGQL